MAKRKPTPALQATDAHEYHVGTWSGQPHYQCRFCMFDTFDRTVILNHLVNEHESMSALEELVKNQDAPTTHEKENDHGTTDPE